MNIRIYENFDTTSEHITILTKNLMYSFVQNKFWLAQPENVIALFYAIQDPFQAESMTI